MHPKGSHRVVQLVATGGLVGGTNMDQELNNTKS